MELDHDNFIDIRQNELGTIWITKIFHQGCGSYFLNFDSYEGGETQFIPLPWSEAKIKKFIKLMDEKE